MSKSELQSQGWNLTDEGFQTISQDGSLRNIKDIIKIALDTDIKEFGAPTLPPDIAKNNKFENLKGNIIVQISKIRNIAAPKANEESKVAPRLLQIELTDGHTNLMALEFEHISALSLNTPPGTKVYLKNDSSLKVAQGILLLAPGLINILGGNVSSLVEKWEISRSLAKYMKGGRAAGATGAPPFIPFGQKLISTLNGKSFKSLGNEKGKDDIKEDAEFIAHRSEAIAEAAKIGTKKTFGGGNRQLVDHNVKKIMEAGYSEEQAQYALKLTKNNVGRALTNLKRLEGRRNYDSENVGRTSTSTVGRSDTRRHNRKEEIESSDKAKPSGKVSLFAFLEDKLPANEAPIAPEPMYNSRSNRFESNNQSRFKNDTDNYNKSKQYGAGNSDARQQGRPNRAESARPAKNDGPNDFNGGKKRYQNPIDNQVNASNTYNNRNFNRPKTSAPNVGDFKGRGSGNSYQNSNNPNMMPPRTQPRRGNDNMDNKFDLNNEFNSMSLQDKKPNQQASFYKQPNNKRSDDNGYQGNRQQQDYNNSYGGNKQGAQQKGANFMNPSQSQNQQFYNNQRRMPSHSNSSGRPLNDIGQQSFASGNSFPTPKDQSQNLKWREGDYCLSKYWEDGKYYEAQITAITDKTCVVRYLEYDSYEEVYMADCLPRTNTLQPSRNNKFYGNQQQQHQQQMGQNQYQPNYNAGERGGYGMGQHNQHNNFSVQRSNDAIRQKNERPIYMPPGQRNN